jgi:hypothetical protein
MVAHWRVPIDVIPYSPDEAVILRALRAVFG